MAEKTLELPEGMQSGADFQALVRAANGGDEEAVKRLRELIQNRPDMWQMFGDLCQHAQSALIRAIAGKSQLGLASIEAKVAQGVANHP